MTERETTTSGGCLCGGVRYRVRGPLRDVVACHCSQCRRWTGHFVAATGAPTANLTLVAAGTLSWYASSEHAERGFCSRCGSSLFWRPKGADAAWTSIMAGSLDGPTGLKTIQHIFVADKADYYALEDGVPQLAQWEG